MRDDSWWWILLLLAALVVVAVVQVVVASFRHYRALARGRFVEFLERRHPEVRILDTTPRSIRFRTPNGREDVLFFADLYQHVDLEDAAAMEAAFERFASSRGPLAEEPIAASRDGSRLPDAR